jgi:hypothetical protein
MAVHGVMAAIFGLRGSSRVMAAVFQLQGSSRVMAAVFQLRENHEFMPADSGYYTAKKTCRMNDMQQVLFSVRPLKHARLCLI